MTTTPAQLLASQKASLDAMLAAQYTLFNGLEQLVDLNLKVAKAVLDDTSEKVQEFITTEDPREGLTVLAATVQPSPEKFLAYSKQVYNIMSGVQSHLGKLTETQIAEAQKQLTEMLEQVSKYAPAGSENLVGLIKSSLSSLQALYDSFAKAARQVAVVTESNIAAATAATLDAAEESSKAGAARANRRAAAAAPAASA